jgi:MFS-type transporter involved in bile tolerance (Atg22 family)
MTKCQAPANASQCRACVRGEGLFLWDVASAKMDALPRLTVSFFGEAQAFTFSLRVISISVIVSALMCITLGGIADYENNRKGLFSVATVFGALMTMMFIFVGDPSW